MRRENYVPDHLRQSAYEDTPLPIEDRQTISQPYIVALMVEALGLRGGERVLEVGTGSGYAAAVLAEIAGEVYTIERHESLAGTASERLAREGYENAHVRHGDGTLGWPDAAPFDAIVVAAGAEEVPAALKEQLVSGGRLVIPVGPSVHGQVLKRITRIDADRFEEEDLTAVRPNRSPTPNRSRSPTRSRASTAPAHAPLCESVDTGLQALQPALRGPRAPRHVDRAIRERVSMLEVTDRPLHQHRCAREELDREAVVRALFERQPVRGSRVVHSVRSAQQVRSTQLYLSPVVPGHLTLQCTLGPEQFFAPVGRGLRQGDRPAGDRPAQHIT